MPWARLLCLLTILVAARPAGAWTTLLNGSLPGDGQAVSAARDAGGNVYVAGSLTTGTGTDLALVKLTGDAEQWRYVLNGSANGFDGAGRVLVAPDGNPVLAGSVNSAGAGTDWVIAKLAADTGTELWRRTIDYATGDDSFRGAALDAMGNVVVCGSFGTAPGTSVLAVVKLSGANGNELWRYTSAPAASFDFAVAVAVSSAGDALLGARLGGKFTALRLRGSDGMPQWTIPLADGSVQAIAYEPSAAAFDLAGSVPSPDGADLFVARFAVADGMPLWTYAASGNDALSFDSASAVAPARDGSGDVFVVGNVVNAATTSDIFAARLASNTGGDLWTKTLDGASEFDRGADVAVDAGGNPVLIGYFGVPGGSQDLVAAKLFGTSGNVAWSAVLDGGSQASDTGSAVLIRADDDPIALGRLVEAGETKLAAVHLRATDGNLVGRFTASGGGFASRDLGAAIARDPSGDVVVGGTTRNLRADGSENDDFTVAKLDGRRGRELWRYVLAGRGQTGVLAVAADAGGNVLAVGSAPGADGSVYPDATVVKLAGDGHELWRRQYAGDPMNIDEFVGVAVAADGSVYVAGLLRTATDADLIAVKLSPDGDERWKYVLKGAGTSFDAARAVTLDPAGNPVVVGVTGAADQDGIAVKLAAADGGVMWSKTVLGLMPGGADNLTAVAVDPATGDVLAAGALQNPGASYDFAVVRLAAGDGHELWRQTFDGSAHAADNASAVAVDAAGDVIATGTVNNTTTERDLFVVKLAPDKSVRWTRTVAGTGDGVDLGLAIAADAAGHVAVGGSLAQSAATELFIASFDTANGAERWRRTVDGNAFASSDEARALLVDAQGGILATGAIVGAGTQSDLATLRLAADGADTACLKLTSDDPDCRPCSAGCDDGEPCTEDGCDATSFCAYTAVAGDAAATCPFLRTLDRPECSGAKVPRAIRKGFKKAGKLVTHALAAKKARSRTRLLGKSSKLLGRVLTAIDKAAARRRRPLPAACAAALRSLVLDTKARVEALAPAPA